MLLMAGKIVFSAVMIAFASWLAGKRPELAGFIIALPLTTLLVLPLSYAEYQDAGRAVKFAQSIFVAVPLSLLFFVPFLAAAKLQWNFWGLYVSGIALLAGGYFLHRYVMTLIAGLK